MCRCHMHGRCRASSQNLDRRHFLKGCSAALLAGAGSLKTVAAQAPDRDQVRARVAAVFLMSMDTREIWPYPDYNTKGRQQEVLIQLRRGCPQIELVPVTVERAADMQRVSALKDRVDGFLVYTMTLVWRHRQELVDIVQLGKPTVVVDEFLGGSGVFLTGYSDICDRNLPAAAVSTNKETSARPAMNSINLPAS